MGIGENFDVGIFIDYNLLGKLALGSRSNRAYIVTLNKGTVDEVERMKGRSDREPSSR